MKKKFHIITIKPSRNFDSDNLEDRHFRIAESQFQRMIKQGGHKGTYEVSAVEYVVNPQLIEKFNKTKKGI